MDTALEVRDEGGRVVTEGEGQVFIGGEDRVCLLDDEEEAVAGTMRATGDWVEVRGAQMFHLGRRDRLVKRHGKRVHLDGVQQLISSLPEVEVCAVALHGGQRLLAFVVASAAERGEVVRPSAPPPDGDLRRLILNRLSLLLPSHSVPDTLVLVPALSMTPHGKVDMAALMETLQRRRRVAFTDLRPTLSSLWREALSLPGDAAVDEASNFLSSGGDSLKALHLHEEILAAAGAATSPELLEVILDGTFADVLRHVERAAAAAESEKRRADERHADRPHAALAKRQRTSADEDASPAGEVPGAEVLGLELSWSSDTGRCVDASPALLASAGGATAFIGSHSHRIQALDLTAGRLLWERVLGGRIEASAAVSRCGRLVVVGCYDGRVYFLCAASGETRWTFQTGDAVKSRAAVDPLTGLVMVGSHDGHVYALDPEDTGAVLWSHRRDVPFFSSPDAAAGRVVVGSVDGNICCYSDEGELVWQFLTEGPVFSSPRVTPDHQGVLCGSHDGRLRRLSLADGAPVWAFRAPGKVYSSPCVLDGSVVGRGGTLVVLASTDGTVGVLDGRSGRLLASLRLPGELFSSPAAHGRSVVIGCRNDFVYCLNLTVKEGT
ncbi:Acyl-CoA synthetase family member 4 [Liparis tanakae]|uniref:Acyl-CoA synthetase family member 4 n=1 Tax=Liparis tanakae TaxID=230148 RepID=A0A4Z2FGI5_9TELE|nr:Acyl-CoA synthetase family member 4 [Liparis tanakae]